MGEVNSFIQAVPLEYFIILSSVLFCLGVLGVLIRKNAIIILGCVELMLNSVNLLLAAFSSYKGDGNGQILVFYSAQIQTEFPEYSTHFFAYIKFDCR